MADDLNDPVVDERVLEPAPDSSARSRRTAVLAGGAAALLLVVAVTALVLTRHDGSSPDLQVATESVVSSTSTVEPTATTGTVADLGATDTTAEVSPEPTAPRATATTAAPITPPSASAPTTTEAPALPPGPLVPPGIELVVGTPPASGSPFSSVRGRWFLSGGLTFGVQPDGAPLYGASSPDYIVVLGVGGEGVGGYVRKGDMADAYFAFPDGVPVYENDGVTLLGHLVTNVGFVPLGSAG